MTIAIDNPKVTSSSSGGVASLALLEDAVSEHQRGGTDLPLWCFLGGRGGPVLELGAGTGRVLAALIAQGVETYGLELDRSLHSACLERLKLAGVQNPKNRVLLGDMRSFELPHLFALIIVPYNTFSLFSDDDVGASLSCASRHLASGGTIFIEAQIWPNADRVEFPWSHVTAPLSIGGEVNPILFSEVAIQSSAGASLIVERRFQMCDSTVSTQTLEMNIRSIPQWDQLLSGVGLSRTGPALDQSGSPCSPESRVVFFEVGSP